MKDVVFDECQTRTCHVFQGMRMKNPESDDLRNTLQVAYRYACTLTNHSVDAEELVQEACLRVTAAGRRFDRPYVLMAVRTSFIDQYRQNARRVRTVGASVDIDSIRKPGESLASLDSDDRTALAEAMASLRLEEREALFFVVGLNQSASQAARSCNKSRGSILSLVSRAKCKLRESLRVLPQYDAPTAHEYRNLAHNEAGKITQ